MTVTANPNKALWEKGDFTQVADTMRASGEALVARLGVSPGMRMLDLGCGDGTTALPAARVGAEVLGVDIAGNLVAAGNRRAQAEGLGNCRFQEGDASHLASIHRSAGCERRVVTHECPAVQRECGLRRSQTRTHRRASVGSSLPWRHHSL